MAHGSSAPSASRLLSFVLAAVCVATATAQSGAYGDARQGYYGYYAERASAGDVGGGAIAAPVSIPEGDRGCYPQREEIHGSDLTAIDEACSADWLDDYHEVDLICPAGSFVSGIVQVKAVSLYDFKGVVQINVTCSDGTKYDTLPEFLSYAVVDNLAYYGDTAETMDYSTKEGFTAIDGSAGCQIDDLDWLEGKDAFGSLVTCPESLVIRGLRIGVGHLLNSIRVCCA